MPACLFASDEPVPADKPDLYSLLRRTIAVRQAVDHRAVALVEILSPGNKSTAKNFENLSDKVVAEIEMRIHALVIDLFPPNTHVPNGIVPAIWQGFGEVNSSWVQANKPLIIASFASHLFPEAYCWPLAVGDILPEVFMVVDEETQVAVALEESYSQAYRGVPEFWREVIERRRAAPA